MSRLERGHVVVLAWAAIEAVTTIALLAWRPDDPLNWGQALGATVGTLVIAALARALGPHGLDERPVPDESVTIPAVAVGIAAILAGVPIGAWLSMIGVGILAFGLAGLLRELRAERRALR